MVIKRSDFKFLEYYKINHRTLVFPGGLDVNRYIFMSFLIALFILCTTNDSYAMVVKCQPSAHIRGPQSFKDDPNSDKLLREIYDTSPLIGIFEVTEVGPRVAGPLGFSIETTVKLRPIEIIKGKVGKEHIHRHSEWRLQGPNPFSLGNKYFYVAYSLETDGTSVSGYCETPFYVELKEAQFFIDKFKNFQKMKETGAPPQSITGKKE